MAASAPAVAVAVAAGGCSSVVVAALLGVLPAVLLSTSLAWWSCRGIREGGIQGEAARNSVEGVDADVVRRGITLK
jgi:hypothetical protein